MTATWTIQARWLFPVVAPPIPDGTLTVAGDRIVAVESKGTRTADIDLGNVAILPGLVNAHIHLDLGGLRGRLPPTSDFADWLRAVVAFRRTAPAIETEAAIRAGIDECLRTGTTLIGDISSGGVSGPLLAASPIRAVVYHELIGITVAHANQEWIQAAGWLDAQRATSSLRFGLSPHAPYTVRRALLSRAAEINVPLAVHLAETRAELELLENRQGPLRAFLEELGAWDPSDLAAGLDDVLDLCRPAAPRLFVHCNYFPTSLVSRLRGATVVYCPRTHAYFGHSPHPFLELVEAGVNVALGTDSLASNPDLNMLAELRFLRRQRPDVPADVLLRMATLAGASGLGWGNELGGLTPGKRADFVALPVPNWDPADPHELLFDSELAISDVWIGGRRIVHP